ncbi:MAG: carbohydrate ABC transporter permease, partial [Clostridia bacterium]|nr:carbohydrate ABC transporter permease [Clostridia bacterium]
AGGTAAIMTVLLLMSTVMVVPMLLTISNAFKPLDELWIFPPKLYAINPTLSNFRDMFFIMATSQVPFLRYVFNTLFITVVGTIGNILLSSMCAFVLAKKRFPGSIVIFKIIVFSLMFSATVGEIINYITMAAFRWLDTYLALIMPACASSLGLYLMKQFIEQVPDSLLEAARIDGAGQWSVFWKIVMPNVRSAWLTLILLSVQSLWGLGATPYIYKEELKTLPYALSQILTAGGIARAGVGAAVTVFMMIMPITIFIITQSNIIETMSSSGLKD